MASTSSNAERVHQLAEKLASRRKRTNFGSTLTLLIGLLAFAALSFYFYTGYTEIQAVTEPEVVFKSAKTMFEDNLHEVSQSAAEEIKKNAPQWAEEASVEILNQMPTAREQIESQLVNFLDTQMAEGRGITKARFVEIVDNNRDEIKTAIAEMSDDEKSKDFLERFMPIVEKEVGSDIRENAAETLGSFIDLNAKLTRLAQGENLNPLEKQQRYILGLIQRLRIENPEIDLSSLEDLGNGN